MGAYTSGVSRSASSSPVAAIATPAPSPRRRRPATGPEQERRKAWGRKWGAIMSQHAQTYKRKG